MTLDKLHLQPITYLINSQWHTLDGLFATSCLGNIRETKAEGEEEEMRTAMPPSASQGEKKGFLTRGRGIIFFSTSRSDATCPGVIKEDKAQIISTRLWHGLCFNMRTAWVCQTEASYTFTYFFGPEQTLHFNSPVKLGKGYFQII